MGGVKSRPKYNNTPCIRRNPVETTVYKEKITKGNYETKLRQYNLTSKEMYIIKSGFFCKSRKNQRVNKFFFNNLKKKKKGWGILFWYRKKTIENRALTFDEIENIKKEMKNKIEIKLLV